MPELLESRPFVFIDAQLIGQLEEMLNEWEVMPASKMTADSYKDPERYERERKNKLRRNWFTGVAGYCELILQDIASEKRADEWSQRLSAIKDHVRQSEWTDIVDVAALEKLARELLAYLEESDITARLRSAA